MEPKEAIERVVIASALLATSFIPKNSEVKASYYKENIPSYSNPLPQKEFATEQELSPEPNYCEIPRQRNDSLFADFVDWDPFFPNSTIGPQKSSEMIVENEKREITFDPQNYDFTEFANYSLKSTELLPDNSIFEIMEDKVPLYLIPINYDKEIETYSSEVKQAFVGEGTNFDIAQIRVIETSDGTTVEIGVLSNTFKSRYAGVILMSVTDKDGNVLNLVRKNQEIDATATAIMTEEETYPNEVINNLMAIKKITEFQETNCFEAGKEYSYISLIGIDTYKGLSEYLTGFTNSNKEVLAGGVCVTATALSSLFYQVEGAKIKNTPHRIAYPQGPYSGVQYTIDSGIETYFNDKYNVDLKWIFPESGYLVFNINMAPSQKDFKATTYNGVGGYSDVFFSYSVSFSKERPINQVQQIDTILQDYQNYRDARGSLPLNINYDYQLKSFPVDTTNKNICDLLYNKPE